MPHRKDASPSLKRGILLTSLYAGCYFKTLSDRLDLIRGYEQETRHIIINITGQ